MQSQADKKARKKKRKCKTVVAKVGGFSIRSYGNRFVIQIRRDGLNETTYHDTLDAAEAHALGLANKKTNEGLSAFNLSPTERSDARKALDELAGRATLRDAVKAWLRLNPTAGFVTVSDLIRRHLDDLAAANRRPATITERRVKLAVFARDFGSRPASSVTRDDVAQFLAMRSAGAFNNHRLNLSALFGYAMRAGIVEANPAAAVAPRKAERGEPAFWPVATVAAFLEAAAIHAPATVPAFALSAFAGLRPEEAARLDWSSVNLAERSIRVPAAASKVRRARQFTMPDNLDAWLRPFARESGPVAPSPAMVRRWRRRLAAVVTLGAGEVKRRRAAAHGKPPEHPDAKAATWGRIEADAKAKAKGAPIWPADVLRHSFATHSMAADPHEGRLAETMGNSPAVIHRHYKGITTAAKGREYFNLMPPAPIRLVEYAEETA